MAVSIDTVTKGYSASGAQSYLNDLNAKAIDETKTLVRNIDGIRSAVEAGWQGKAEQNFMENLFNGAEAVANSLDEVKAALDAEFGSIEQSIHEQDEGLVPLE